MVNIIEIQKHNSMTMNFSSNPCPKPLCIVWIANGYMCGKLIHSKSVNRYGVILGDKIILNPFSLD